MRVLFLSTWFPFPPDNGSKVRVYYLLKALGKSHDVILVSLAFGTSQPERCTARDLACKAVRVIKVNPFDRPRFSLLFRFLSLTPVVTWPIAEVKKVVADYMTTQHFDVAVVSNTVMAHYIPYAIPMILEEHNSFSRLMYERYRSATNKVQMINHWVSWQKTRYFERNLFRRFDLVTMVSEEDRRTSEELLGQSYGRLEVIPNGVDCVHNRPGLVKAHPHTLIYNGALTYSANYDAMRYFLAEMYPLIQEEISEISLKITGSTQGVNLSDLQLDDSVQLTGYVEDIRLAVAGSTVCVVPLRQGGGTRLKILEAMALGTPVVATAKGAEGLDVIDGEHLLIADEPEGFARAVVQLLQDPDLCSRLATEARSLVEERYDWAQIGQQFVELVEETAIRHGQKRHDS